MELRVWGDPGARVSRLGASERRATQRELQRSAEGPLPMLSCILLFCEYKEATGGERRTTKKRVRGNSSDGSHGVCDCVCCYQPEWTNLLIHQISQTTKKGNKYLTRRGKLVLD